MIQVAPPETPLALRMIGLRRQIDELELRFSRLAAEFERRSDIWDQEGFNSAIDWIRFNCKMTSTAAADRVAVGERVNQLGRSVQAVETHEIGFAHLTVMARTAGAVGAAFNESKLLGLAREASPGKFHYQCLHYRHSVDAARYAAEQELLAEQRHLRLTTAEDGCLVMMGVLDPTGGAAVRSALEPLAHRSGAHDHRTREERLADALVELATGARPVSLQVTSSVETLLAVAGAPGAETQFSLPISSRTVERWACDCSVTRILLQDSVVIDVGRSKRTVEGPVRRALEARDGHCRWPDCDRPPKWSAAHHVVHWVNGGSTGLDNLILLCHRHHRMVHEGGWQLVRSEGDGDIIVIAPMITFGEDRSASANGPPRRVAQLFTSIDSKA
ncbi:MAG TPA: DUF222 domain-containing protein [Candidatus Dormibacteraeota bacterium]|nr:DUF222 domain-containing protein [Candidatus Dormibacteraeota bacterium]